MVQRPTAAALLAHTAPLDLTGRVQLDRWVVTDGRVVEVTVLDGEPVDVYVVCAVQAMLSRAERSRGTLNPTWHACSC